MNKFSLALVVVFLLVSCKSPEQVQQEEFRNNMRQYCKAIYDMYGKSSHSKHKPSKEEVMTYSIYCYKDKLRDER